MKVLNKFLKNGTGNYVEGVVNGRTGSGPVRSTSCETPHDTFKIASWNIGTMRGRSSEIVETITRRNIDLCCVQEVRWRGASARHIRNDGCINSITEFEVVGQRGRGRPKKTWKDTINNDLRHWKLSRADPANRMEWRKKLRTNIGAVRPTLSGTDTLNE